MYNKTHVLIVCHSAAEIGKERRDVIRNTWAKDAKSLPVLVIFFVGMIHDEHQNKSQLQQGNEIYCIHKKNDNEKLKNLYFRCIKK